MVTFSAKPNDDVDIGRRLFAMSTGVFFVGGFLTAIVSLLVPHFKLDFGLDYTQALLIQVASHLSYLLFALPIALAVGRIGYMRAIAAGTIVMAAACLAIAAADGFVGVLAALLLLSLGITFLQIAANTVVTVVGVAGRSAARLTLLQGFNALGTVLGPLVAAPFLLGGSGGPSARSGLMPPFVGSATVLVLLAIWFAAGRNLLATGPARVRRGSGLSLLPDVLRDRRLLAGTGAIFVYVGAEVTIGTLLTSYLIRSDVLGVIPVVAGRLVALYWGGAMVGRFVGAWSLGRGSSARQLGAVAVVAAGLVAMAVAAQGMIAAAALLAVGLCNAIMYPTIYALALPREPDHATLGAMLLCMAVVGGAMIPLLTGMAADAVGLRLALAIPALCYGGIALFAVACSRSPRCEP